MSGGAQMKHGNVLQEALLKKLKGWVEILFKIETLEKEKSGLTEDELLEDEEYGGLLDKSGKLHNEVNSLLVESKFFPLVGLSEKQSELLAEVYKKLNKSGLIEQKHIELSLEIAFENFYSDFVGRARQVEPLFLTRHLDWRTDELYQEVINCYIYGAFYSSCVLCRAITESVAKRFIELKGKSSLLTGQESQQGSRSIPDILKNELLLANEILSLYSKIGNKADNILHNSNEKTTKEDALKAIELLQHFLNKFPKI